METLTAMLDSLHPADSARSVEAAQRRRPTSADVLAGGYNCQQNIPEPVECEFCGRKLYHEALVMGRTVLMFAPFPQRCTCDRAKAKWAEADAEEARQKAEAHNSAENAHGDIRASVAAMNASIKAIELKFGTNVTKNPFSATFGSLDGLTVTGVWNADQARVEF